MENAFSQTIAAWHDFYLMLGTAAATLVGLLFVAVSLHLDVLTRKEHAAVTTLAFKTFMTFISLLLFALYFLIPDQGPQGLGLPLFFTALIMLITLSRGTVNFWQSILRLWGDRFFFWRVLMPGLCYLGVMAVALLILAGRTDYLYWLVPVFAILLGVAARNAWDLLLQVGADQQAQRDTGTDGDPQLRRVEKALREVTRRQRQITRQQEDATRNGMPGGPAPPRRRG